jgi:hypothetical protein
MALFITVTGLPCLGNPGTVMAQGSPAEAIPPELRAWQGWALQGAEFLRCPYVSGMDAREPGSRVCHWIGALRIDAAAAGASFQQDVHAFAPGWIALPGDLAHWPQDVRVDGSIAPVVARSGRPMLWLERDGAYTVTGDVPWPRLPDSLAVPATAGIISLVVAGQPVRDPEFGNGAIRLGAQPTPTTTEANRLEVRVHRKLTDTIPGQLETRLTLQVAGQAREAHLGPLLPAGFVAMGLQTPLPARLEPDGRLRVQVRPGSWVVVLRARAAGILETVSVPAAAERANETWSFAAVDRLRVAAVEGAAAVDPAQANAPPEWQALPAFTVGAGADLRIVERSRGLAGQDLNRLHVQRNLWLDFAGDAYTFQDRVTGEMQQEWRLDMRAPFELQGARHFEQPLLITRGAKPGSSGVEWRARDVRLEATGRVERSDGRMPASGWDARLAGLGITLHLPPGHRLLAAAGADRAPSAWLDRWQLLDIFAVLLVVAATFRIAGVPAAVLAAAALVLAHHEQRAATWLFLNLLIAVAIARAVPAGRFTVWIRLWRNLAFALLAVTLIPFTLYQARIAFFPQLEVTTTMPWDERAVGGAAEESQERLQDLDMGESVGVAAGARVKAGTPVSLDAVSASPSPPPVAPGNEPQLHAAGTVLQSGPGVPQWTYNVHRLEWGGPVEPAQTLRLVVLSPLVVSVWRLLACLLLAGLFVLLLSESYGRPRWAPLERWLRRKPAVAAMGLAAMAMFGLAVPEAAQAQSAPAPEILQELKQRLSKPPPCAPECVAIAAAGVRVPAADMLEIELEAHAQTRAVLPLPAAVRHWTIESVRVDGDPMPATGRDDSGRAIVALEPGVRTVILRGRLTAADTVRIAFPVRPARVLVDAADWSVTGVDEGRLLADSITLTRRAVPGPAQTAAAAAPGRATIDEFPPFVRVTRRLALGLDGWTVRTTVARLAPRHGAFTLRLPLLPGEAVLTANLPVREGSVAISMPADVDSVQWQSTLTPVQQLQLQAPPATVWTEAWQVDPNALWRVSFAGTPEVFADPAAERAALHRFDPRPGETLQLTFAQPEPAPGASVTFERASQRLQVGQRARDTSLLLSYRSTQGGRHELQLPDGSRLTSVLADGQALAIRAEQGKLVLPLQPGPHELAVSWQSDQAPALVTRPDAVVIGAPASNVATAVELPDTRWVLFAGGGGVGPAVLYWAELVVFVVLAVLLGRFTSSPLATREWLLVGLGLSTFSWSVLLLFAIWVFALQWRRGWPGEVQPWIFNAVQVGLVILTIVALGSLVAAIPNGLLGTPDMRVAGAGSTDNLLTWFHDRVETALPQPVVVSVSIWFYKIAMLAWALWLSFALVRWVRKAWEAFTAGRLWYTYNRPVQQAIERPTHDAS